MGGWLPDEGVALCTAGEYEETVRYVDCIKKAYWPFYASRGEGLDWSKSASTAKAAEVCQLRELDPEQARAHADCLFRAKGWLPDEGVALCTAGKYEETVRYVDCIKKAYWPFYASRGEGLDWSKS